MPACTAIVNCAEPVDEFGSPKYLRRVCGQPLLAVLSQRLRQIGSVRQVVLLLHEHDRKTAEFAREAGWQVVSIKRWRSFLAAPLLKMLRTDYWVLVDPEYPFVDPGAWGSIASQMEQSRRKMLRIDPAVPLLPRMFVRRDLALRMVLGKLAGRSAMDVARHASGSAESGAGCDILPRMPDVASLLRADRVDTGLIEYLGGLNVTIGSLQALESDPGFSFQKALAMARDRLYETMIRSHSPHKWNRKLNRLESQHLVADVRSYPLDVALNLTTVCNARCVFCNYPAVSGKTAHYLTLEDIRSWSWLQYVSKVGFGGGIGDPLAHPEFPAIFGHIAEHYPHLSTRVITNGIGLTKETCDAFAGKLSRLRISLNAATGATWQTLMGGRAFERVCEHVSYLKDEKKRRGTDRPEIRLLMVLNRHNVHEIAAFAALARDLGAQAVEYNHFTPSVMPQGSLDSQASLYYDRQRANAELARARRLADSYGIEFDAPPLFGEACEYFEGCRLPAAPEQCYSPWEVCLLVVDDQGRRQMFLCCVGVNTEIRYDKLDLSDAGFRLLWNHPSLRYLRETANNAPGNAMCKFCRSEDRQDPENTGIYQLRQRLHPQFLQFHRHYRKAKQSQHLAG